MTSILLWLILLVLCWPLAVIYVVLYPIIWLLLLPFRLLGFVVNLSFAMVGSILLLPFVLVRR